MKRELVILAVDDRPDNLFVMREIIREYIPECQVMTAHSADEGLAIAATVPLDGALIDLQMPGRDGIDMCRCFKADPRTAHVPLIIMTAHQTSPELRARALEAGADDFISKPVNNIELAARIKVILRAKRAEDALRTMNDELENLVAQRTQALRKSEESFRFVADGLPVLIAHIDSEQRCRFANKTLEEWLGRAPSEIIGRKVGEVVGRDLHDQIRGEIEEALSGRQTSFEGRLTLPDGRPICISTQAIPQIADDGHVSGVFLLGQDITRMKQAEEERNATIELLHLINQSGTTRELMEAVVLFLQNVAGCEAAGIRLQDSVDFPYFVAKGFSEQFIRSESALCEVDDTGKQVLDHFGSPILECLCGKVISGMRDPLDDLFTAHGSFWTNGAGNLASITCASRGHGGRMRFKCLEEGFQSIALIPLHGGGRTFGLLQFNDRRKELFTSERIGLLERLSSYLSIGVAQRMAEEERSLLATAVEQAGEAFLLMDGDRTIRYANPAFQRISGYSCEEVAHKPIAWLGTDKDHGRFQDEIWDTVNRNGRWTGRLTGRKKNGALFECETTVSPVLSNSGHIENCVMVMRDVSEMANLERRLRQAQKMEAIGTLSGGIAHDFNNILSPIMGYAEIMLAELPDGSALRRDLEQILKASQRASDLVKQILRFSRQTEVERKPIQVSIIIKEALKLMRASLPSTIDIRQNIPRGADSSFILADPTQIHQILMNLCTNAAHAMREKGGELELSLRREDLDAEAVSTEHPDLKPGPYLRLSVRDTGCGMDALLQQRIFDPYFTTKKQGEGTGLGLAVVYGIVKGHGGALSVSSEPSRGTVFHILLPRINVMAEKEATELVPPPRGTERILLVDDEEMVATMSKRLLERLGYQVVANHSSRDALEAFRARPESFDLVITDQTMPHMTGVELAKELLRIRPEVPIIISTGFSEMIDEETAKAMGIRGFVMKPALAGVLAAKVREVLDFS